MELTEDVTLDVDQDNRIIGIDIQHVSSLEEEYEAGTRPGQRLKLVDPEHEDQLQVRLENANQHFRRLAAEVLDDQEALRLLARFHQEGSIESTLLLDQAIPLAMLTAANFCQVGANLIYITDPGIRFVNSLKDIKTPETAGTQEAG